MATMFIIFINMTHPSFKESVWVPPPIICKAQGTDFGNELAGTAKLGSYAFYVANMEAGKCPAGW